jgi:hypothetical protein
MVVVAFTDREACALAWAVDLVREVLQPHLFEYAEQAPDRPPPPLVDAHGQILSACERAGVSVEASMARLVGYEADDE